MSYKSPYKISNPGLQKFIVDAVFPVGLMLVVIAGSELFTGNTSISVPGVLSKRITWYVLLFGLPWLQRRLLEKYWEFGFQSWHYSKLTPPL